MENFERSVAEANAIFLRTVIAFSILAANPVLGTVVTTTVRLYAVYPFLTTISSAPTAVGNVYYRVTETVYSSGITIQTATRSVVGGTLTNGVVVTAVQ